MNYKIFLTLLFLCFCFSCKKSVVNTTNKPRVTNKMPINAPGGWSDSPSISRDGKRLYFMYSRYNFGPWIQSGGSVMPVLSGPDRPGLNKATVNPFDESDIYVATKNADGTWSDPVNLGLNSAWGDSSGMEIDNGNTFIWLRGNGSRNNIVIAQKNGSGQWGTPVDMGTLVNNTGAGVLQDNPHLSADGKAVWFVSNRAGGQGGKDIWFTYNASGPIGGSWSAPVNAGTLVNTSGDEDQPWISPYSSDIIWNGPAGVMHCLSNGSDCNASPTTITIPGCAFTAELSIPDDGKTAYFGCGNFINYEVKIMYSIKQSDNSWGPAILIDQ